MPDKQTAVATIDNLSRMPLAELERQPVAVLAKYADDLRQSKIVALGDGQAFARFDRGGKLVRSVKARISLSAAEGEIYSITAYDDEKNKYKKTNIAAPGYFKMNKVAGVSLVTPPHLILNDGRKVSNPYADDEKGEVIVRKVAVGYSPLGNLVAIDSYIRFDVHTYWLESVLKAIQYENVGEVVSDLSITNDQRTDYFFVPIMPGLSAKLNRKHKEFLKLLQERIQLQKYIERRASTIAERNALKKHPLIAAQTVVTTGEGRNRTASVEVFGWKADAGDELSQVVDAIQNEKPMPDVIDIQEVRTDSADDDSVGAEMASSPEDDAALPEDIHNDDSDAGDAAEPGEVIFKETMDARTRFDMLKKHYGDEAVKKVFNEIPVPWESMTTGERIRAANDCAVKLAQLRKEGKIR